MEKYRRIRVIGKGSFGYAVLVSDVSNKKSLFVMKVKNIKILKKIKRSLISQKWTTNKDTTQSTKSKY